MEQTIVDIFTFQKEAGVDYNTLKELYLIFAEEIKQEKNEINEINNVDELIKVIHKIKGIAGSYRTPVIFQYAAKIEQKLKDKDLDNLNRDLDKLNEAIQQVTDILGMYFEI